MINQGSTPTGPGAARVVRLLHGAILLGLATMGVVFAGLVRLRHGPVLGEVQSLGLALAAVSVVLLTLALAVLRPRIAGRPVEQPADEYWADAGTRTLAVLLWATLEGSGVVGAVGYLLTGTVAPAVTAAVALVALFSVRPAQLEA